MTKWLHTLDIKDSWQKCREGTITAQALSAEISEKLTALGIEDDNWLENLICEFDVYADENGEVDLEEFDITMDQLYDWADQRVGATWNVGGISTRLCWINTWYPR